MTICRLHLGAYGVETVCYVRDVTAATAGGCQQLTDRAHDSLQDVDLRNFARVVSACTLGLWAFAAGLLIGTFLFS